MQNIAIIIPCRLKSSRLKNKPLHIIHDNKTLLELVYDNTIKVTKIYPQIKVYLAIDNEKTLELVKDKKLPYILTDESCRTGTDRVFMAAKILNEQNNNISHIINVQGDAPFMPIEAIVGLVEMINKNHDLQFASVASKLNWNDFEILKEHKKKSPSSGTTAIIVKSNDGFLGHWFSKEIIPSIYRVDKDQDCPVYRHLGIYAYSFNFLEKFINMDTTYYEKIEQLEQLRAIENGIYPHMFILNKFNHTDYSSIDTELDVENAKKILAEKKETTTLLICRHGNTFEDGETPKRIGSRTDLPLTIYGKQQIHDMAFRIQKKGLNIDLIISSPLKRTKETAEIINQYFKSSELIFDNRLKEIDYGPDENKTDEEIKQQIGEQALIDWNEKLIMPKRWPNNPQNIIESLKRLIDELNINHKGKNILIVTSNGIAKYLSTITNNLPLSLKTGSFGEIKIYDGYKYLFGIINNIKKISYAYKA